MFCLINVQTLFPKKMTKMLKNLLFSTVVKSCRICPFKRKVAKLNEFRNKQTKKQTTCRWKHNLLGVYPPPIILQLSCSGSIVTC